jgi:hypothetical protein
MCYTPNSAKVAAERQWSGRWFFAAGIHERLKQNHDVNYCMAGGDWGSTANGACIFYTSLGVDVDWGDSEHSVSLRYGDPDFFGKLERLIDGKTT